MPVVIVDIYKLIDQYTIRPTVVVNVDVVTIRQRRNSDTSGVIIDE